MNNIVNEFISSTNKTVAIKVSTYSNKVVSEVDRYTVYGRLNTMGFESAVQLGDTLVVTQKPMSSDLLSDLEHHIEQGGSWEHLESLLAQHHTVLDVDNLS